jgi:hypothetical protein
MDQEKNIINGPTYQFKDFVNLKLRALLGTFEIAMTWMNKHMLPDEELKIERIPL